MMLSGRVRVLPLAIGVATVVLGLRLGDVFWRPAGAQAQQPAAPAPAAAPAGTPAQTPAATPAQTPAQGTAQTQTPAQAPAGGTAAPGRQVEDVTSLTGAEIEVLQQLVNRRAEIEKRSAEVARREAVLKAAEERIGTKIQELKKLQASVEQAIRRYDEQEEQRRKSLVKIYETMKPAEAARIFEQMDLPTLVEMVERMSERKVAPVLAAMNPVRAKQVTTELAKRRKPGELGAGAPAAAAAPAPAAPAAGG